MTKFVGKRLNSIVAQTNQHSCVHFEVNIIVSDPDQDDVMIGRQGSRDRRRHDVIMLMTLLASRNRSVVDMLPGDPALAR